MLVFYNVRMDTWHCSCNVGNKNKLDVEFLYDNNYQNHCVNVTLMGTSIE